MTSDNHKIHEWKTVDACICRKTHYAALIYLKNEIYMQDHTDTYIERDKTEIEKVLIKTIEMLYLTAFGPTFSIIF